MKPQKKWMTVSGWVLAVLIVALLSFSAFMKLQAPKAFMDQWVDKFGYPSNLATTIALVEIGCALLFLIPRTTVLGAILLTGYLGGATATHVRIHDAFIPPVVVGMFVWLSVFLREPLLRTLLVYRKMAP